MDHEKWELNQLRNGGAGILTANEAALNEEEDDRVLLIVHEIKPPFLDGRFEFSR